MIVSRTRKADSFADSCCTPAKYAKLNSTLCRTWIDQASERCEWKQLVQTYPTHTFRRFAAVLSTICSVLAQPLSESGGIRVPSPSLNQICSENLISTLYHPETGYDNFNWGADMVMISMKACDFMLLHIL